jgi:hypothetical protein
MFEDFGANRDIVIAKAEGLGRVLEMRGHARQRAHIVEEGGIDIYGCDLAASGGERLGEHPAPHAHFKQLVPGLAVLKRVPQHPVPARAVKLAAGRVRVGVKAALEFDIALARLKR